MACCTCWPENAIPEGTFKTGEGLFPDSSRFYTVDPFTGTMETFLARPDGDARYPVVVMYMDALGIREELRQADVMVLSDYTKGVLTDDVLSIAIAEARAAITATTSNPCCRKTMTSSALAIANCGGASGSTASVSSPQ